MLDQPRLNVENLGLMAYGECLAVQRDLHARVVAGTAPPTVLFVEHPPVLTLGRHADPQYLRFGAEFFAERGIEIFPVERGGEVTAHERGQQVMYPILRLADFRLLPKRYVELLEQVVIGTLKRFGIEATTDPGSPGVWVGGDKIGAVGVRVKDRATLHGVALNVSNDLALFDMIIPCGIQGKGVTTMTHVLRRPVPLDDVRGALATEIVQALGNLRKT